MKCLVTGGAGFIGSNLVDKLISLDYDVIVIDNESAEENEQFYWNQDAINYKYDICNYNKIRPLFHGVDYVFHLAAQSRIQPSIINPNITVKVNCEGTLNVLNAAKENNISKIIYSSTSSYYGLKNASPSKENMSRDCLNPYSYTKVFGEDLCKMYHQLYNIDIFVLRYFNVYGERQPTKGQYAPVIGIFQKQFKRTNCFLCYHSSRQSKATNASASNCFQNVTKKIFKHRDECCSGPSCRSGPPRGRRSSRRH